MSSPLCRAAGWNWRSPRRRCSRFASGGFCRNRMSPAARLNRSRWLRDGNSEGSGLRSIQSCRHDPSRDRTSFPAQWRRLDRMRRTQSARCRSNACDRWTCPRAEVLDAQWTSRSAQSSGRELCRCHSIRQRHRWSSRARSHASGRTLGREACWLWWPRLARSASGASSVPVARQNQAPEASIRAEAHMTWRDGSSLLRLARWHRVSAVSSWHLSTDDRHDADRSRWCRSRDRPCASSGSGRDACRHAWTCSRVALLRRREGWNDNGRASCPGESGSM